MLRNICAMVAFVALVALTHGVVDAQGGKKQFGGKKAPPVAPDVKQDADGRSKQGPTYMPLQVGNRWEYTLTQKDKSVTLVTKIARIEVIGALALAVLESEIDGKITATEHLREVDQGVYRVKSGQLAPSPPLLVLKSPVKGGDKWNAGFVIGKTKGSYSVETAEEEIEVPAGKFKTILTAFTIKLGAKPSVTKTWYAENVGIVKQTIGDDVVAVLRKLEVPSAPANVAAASNNGKPSELEIAPEAKSATTKAKSTSLFPLQVGNKWEYDFKLKDRGKAVVEKSFLRVVRTETVDDIAVSVVEAEMAGEIAGAFYLRQSDDGIFCHRIDNAVQRPPLLLLKMPLKERDKWIGTSVLNKNKTTYLYESEQEDVEVPFGRFKTIRVKATIDERGKKSGLTTFWLADNVGIVKFAIDVGPGAVVGELRNVELKNGFTRAPAGLREK